MVDLQFQNLQALDGIGASAAAYGDLHHQARTHLRQAAHMFNQACLLRHARRAWAWLTRRPASLLELEREAPAGTIAGCYYAGLQAVPISQIRGSEGRSRDFDSAFRPQNEHTRERWVGIAMVRLAGTPMPPVTLIRVHDVYFVRDGHHRISVARALGEEYIEAEVTAWSVRGAAEEPGQQAASTTPPTLTQACGASA